MPLPKLVEFLDRNNIAYITIAHSTAYTAQQIAALTHISGREVAKTVIVNLDGALAMAVLPASQQIDLAALAVATRTQSARIAPETEFKGRFPDCETGAMPPFGNLYNMAVYVEEALTRDKDIAFNAGSHNQLVRLSYQDFERLVKPMVARFARQAGRTAA